MQLPAYFENQDKLLKDRDGILWFSKSVVLDDNEAKSANYAEIRLARLGIGVPIIAEASRLILLTAGHEVGEDDDAGRVLIDADLAVLGASPDTYDRYAAEIRREYAHVSDVDFATGRVAVLEGFLARPRLFLTDLMHKRLDHQARHNLRAEIQILQTTTVP